VTAAERALLREVLRWARAEGVRLDGASRWTSPPPHRWGVDFVSGDEYLMIWRRGQNTGKDYFVVDVAEAVDVLCALDILPPRFSTAYRAGWDAMGRYAETAHYGAEYTAIRPAAKRELARP
jgi:hypothetical protein